METLELEKWNGIERRKSKKILYCDDNKDELELFSIMTSKLGFTPTTVLYASDFIKEFETGTYDIAFIDFMLSVGDGITITRLLHREKAPNTKIYILTAYDKTSVMRRVNGDKIHGVLDKTIGLSKALSGVLQ